MAAGGEQTAQWIPELVKFLNLAVIGVIIYFFAKKGIVSSLKQRSEDISKKIIDAKIELERMQFEADRAKREIAEINSIKENLMNEMRESGLKTYEQLVKDAKIASERIIQDAKLAADNEIISAIGRVKKQVVDAAIEQALNLVSENNGSDTQSKMHAKLLERFTMNLQEKEGMGHGV